MPKLYTSRFHNKELETGKYPVVGVVRSMPRFPVKYRISGDIIQIAPPGYLWNENDRAKFREPYFRHLEKSGYPVMGAMTQSYLDEGKDVVLCCYEDVRKPGEWCHRLVFAEWWYEKDGTEDRRASRSVTGFRREAKEERGTEAERRRVRI